MLKLLMMMALAVPAVQDEERRDRKPDPQGLKRQAEEIDAKLQALAKSVEELKGEKRDQALAVINDLRAMLKSVNDQILRFDPKEGRPQPNPREKELVEGIGRIQKRIQNKDFKNEEEATRLLNDQKRLEGELEEIRAHLRDMKGMHQPPNQPMQPLNDESRKRMVDEIAPWLKEAEPQTAERLNSAASERRLEEFDRLLRDAYGRFQAMRELKQRDPKEFERVMKMNRLEHESRMMGDEIRRLPADDAKRTDLKKKLAATLVELFELREAGRWRELEALEFQVKDLRKTLEGRKENKDKIIDKRTKELSGEKSDEDW